MRVFGSVSAFVLLLYVIVVFGPFQIAPVVDRPPLPASKFFLALLAWSWLPALFGTFWLFWSRPSKLNQGILVALIVINVMIVAASYAALGLLNENEGAAEQIYVHTAILLLVWVGLPIYVLLGSRKSGR
jgi:hypothetical protein